MKKFILLFLILIGLPVYSVMLTGEIKYSKDDALIELQNNIPYGIDFLLINNHTTDKNKRENQSYLLHGQTKLNDRTLAKFSDDSYGVNYKNDPSHVWYYDKDGGLINVELRTSLSYPYRSYKYSTDGELVNMSMRVSESETYIFNPLGQLLGHWLGANCYNENGKVIMTRKIMK